MTGRPAGSCPPDLENVIPLGDRRRATPPREERMATPAYDGPSPEQKLAAAVQAAFTGRGRTLTDPDTSEAYDLTLESVLKMVDGMFVKGHLGEEEHGRLRRHLDNLRRVPELL